MYSHGIRPCPCGSDKPSQWQYDGRNIPLCRTCDDCHETKMAGYRDDVLEDPNYWADEEIEGEEPEGSYSRCYHCSAYAVECRCDGGLA